MVGHQGLGLAVSHGGALHAGHNAVHAVVNLLLHSNAKHVQIKVYKFWQRVHISAFDHSLEVDYFQARSH